MNTDNKYYTPEITEFRVGFEFEAYNTKWVYPVEYLGNNKCKVLSDPKYEESWYKEVYLPINYMYNEDGDTIIDNLENEIENNKVRVKYLDLEDIEKLGWTKVGKYDDKDNYIIPYFTKLKKYKLYPYGENKVMITKTRLNIPEGMRVAVLQDYEIEETMFNGFIKNKSELEVLMKQLGI